MSERGAQIGLAVILGLLVGALIHDCATRAERLPECWPDPCLMGRECEWACATLPALPAREE